MPAGRPGRRLLVTGGSGQLGSEVVATASAAGWDVVATTHRSPGRRIDLADTASVERLVHELRPRAVVHTAYAKDVPQMYAVIVDGSAALARACAAVDARLVHVSSDAVFSGTAGRPYVEADRPDPVNAYGGAKAAAEERVLRAARDAVAVRTSLLLGGRERPGPHERAAADPAGTFWSDAVRCPVAASDLAAALVELVDVDVTGVLHVAGPDALTRAELAALVTGARVRSAPAPPDVPLDVRLDSAAATAALRTRVRGALALYG